MFLWTIERCRWENVRMEMAKKVLWESYMETCNIVAQEKRAITYIDNNTNMIYKIYIV